MEDKPPLAGPVEGRHLLPLSCPFLWAVGDAFPLALLGGQVSFLPRAPQSSWVSGPIGLV